MIRNLACFAVVALDAKVQHTNADATTTDAATPAGVSTCAHRQVESADRSDRSTAIAHTGLRTARTLLLGIWLFAGLADHSSFRLGTCKPCQIGTYSEGQGVAPCRVAPPDNLECPAAASPALPFIVYSLGWMECPMWRWTEELLAWYGLPYQMVQTDNWPAVYPSVVLDSQHAYRIRSLCCGGGGVCAVSTQADSARIVLSAWCFVDPRSEQAILRSGAGHFVALHAAGCP